MNPRPTPTQTSLPLAGAAALWCLATVLLLALTLLLTGCGQGGGSNTASAAQTVTVAGDVPIAYVRRASTLRANPTNGAPTAAGGDLMLREKSSPSAPEHNLTAAITQGRGDASDPEVSYDGRKIVFALRCPSSNTATLGNQQPACTGRWNLWEYDMSSGGLAGGTLRRLTHSSTDDDVDPAYLPAGRGFVFSSNRQTTSKQQALGRTYHALDEYERERVFNLHTMAADGGQVTQISFNQSHDRNPVLRPNGDIMFSRWDHVGGRNHFKIFRIKPDGTDLFVLYGAHSEGNSFLHPRDMDPAGPYKGFVASSLMPLSGTQEGGALVFVDALNYSEQDTPANTTVPVQGGQRQVTAQALPLDGGFSAYGRITTPYPLWDGSNRVLLAYRPCEVSRNGVVVPCASLTPDELTRLSADRSEAQARADALQDNVPPPYAIYMFDPAQQTWLIVAAPPPGFMHTDPVALQPRPEPNATPPSAVDAALAQQGLGLLEVRSVYDTDGLGRMGAAVLTGADLGPGCSSAIALTRPTDPQDTRALVADLLRMKDPADPAYHCAPARFVRVMRAVAPPASSMGLRSAIGETEFEMQQILGYAPVEPDGSFKLTVPADVPLGLAIVDEQGRAFQTHTSWIQLRPGERRTCDGCHSPRRGGAINSGAVVNAQPAALKAALATAHQSGETMASTRTRLDPAALRLSAHMDSTDLWADTSRPGVRARRTLQLRYTGHADATQDLATPAPANGIINYPEHIQPIWSRPRGAATCTGCHTAGSRLDLGATVAGSGRLVSYERLLIGAPALDPATGLVRTRLDEGVPVIVREPPLVDTGASEGEAIGLARKSRLVEILSGQLLMAGSAARTAHPSPALNHATLLNTAEKRLLAEWIDLGGQYYNDPFDRNNQVRSIATLSAERFEAQVMPVLRASCMGACHAPAGSSASPGTTPARANRLVLTGDAEGDFNVVLSMVHDTCRPEANALLARPSTAPHPGGATGQRTPPLAPASSGYAAIAQWIATGCPRP